MTRLISLCALLAAGAAFAKVPVESGSPADKLAVLKVQSDFSAAWGKHDAQAISKLFTTDGDLINPMGRVALGREQIARLVGEEHAGNLKESVMAQTCDRVRFFGGELAQVDCSFTLTGLKGPQETLQGLTTGLLIKEDGSWKIAALRPMIPRVAPALPTGRRGPPVNR